MKAALRGHTNSGASCVVTAYALDEFQVMLTGALLGVSWGAIVPVGVGLFFEYSSRRTRGAAMGAYNLALNVGAAAGAIGVAAFTHVGWGYTGAMLVSGVLPVLALPSSSSVARRRSGPTSAS